MRRMFLLTIVFAIMLTLLAFCVSAEEYTDPYDSRNIPQEIVDNVPGYEDAEFVVRFYGAAVELFYQNDGVEELLNIKKCVYYVGTLERSNIYKIDNGKVTQVGWTGFNEARRQYVTHEAIYKVSPDIRIESIYFLGDALYGSYNYAIYYKTNLGDYVYFDTEFSSGMMMTPQRFKEYTLAWREYRNAMWELHGPITGGRYHLSGDFSVYDWNSPNFDPDAPLPISESEKNSYSAYYWFGGGVVVLVGIVAVGIIITRRKKEEEEVFEDT